MYVILCNDDDSLYGSHKERIIKGSKLVDKLVFIVDPIYKGIDMTDATVLLEYLLPISRKYKTELLTLSDERYNDCYLQYKLPIDTTITNENGSVELQLTFVKSELDENGNSIQRVRKTSSTTIEVTPISSWADVIPDSNLSCLDQRLIKIDSQIRALDEMNQIIADNKADNIKYNESENSLQLMANGNEIGDKVTIKTGDTSLEDGIPSVDFNSTSTNKPVEDEDDDESNAVEF
jgi:hypothetical protein